MAQVPLLDVVHADKPNPKAIIVLFGWFGCKPKHIEKYAQIYQNEGCITIAGTLSDFVVLTKNDVEIDTFVQVAIREANQCLRVHPSIKIVLHIFSNGGGFALERLEKHTGQQDYDVFHKAVVAQIFDSAPAYITIAKGISATRAAIQNALLRELATVFGVIVFTGMHVFSTVTGKSSKGDIYWSNLLDSPSRTKQLFLYSACDALTDCEKLEEFIAQRKQKGIDVATLKFENSPHCQHLRMHQDTYVETILHFLETTISSNTPKMGL